MDSGGGVVSSGVPSLLLALGTAACASEELARGPGGEQASEDQLEKVAVIRGAADTSDWGDLTIHGEGLHEHEGKIVTVRVGFPDRPPERLGTGQVRIIDGGFTISLPDVAETTLYKRRVAFIDVDADGWCDASVDPVFADYRGAGDLELTLVPGDPSDKMLTEGMMLEALIPDRECEEAFNVDWPAE